MITLELWKTGQSLVSLMLKKEEKNTANWGNPGWMIVKGSTGVVQGRQGWLCTLKQKQYRYQSFTHPARLHQVPLAKNTVLNVD